MDLPDLSPLFHALRVNLLPALAAIGLALAGVLRYDLVQSNALKMACTALFSVVALSVFVIRDQVQWVPGLVLALAQVIGVQLSVRFALRVSQAVLRWVLLALVLAVCVAAWFS